MTKEIKIITLLVFLVIVLFVYISFDSKQILINDDESKKSSQNISKQAEQKIDTAKIDLKKLDNEYRQETKNMLSSYEEIIKEEEALVDDPQKISKIDELEKNLMELRVPEEFKNLHLNFVLAVNKIESYAENGNKKEMDDGKMMINQIKNQYSWLN